MWPMGLLLLGTYYLTSAEVHRHVICFTNKSFTANLMLVSHLKIQVFETQQAAKVLLKCVIVCLRPNERYVFFQ